MLALERIIIDTLDSSTSGEVKSVFNMLLDFIGTCHVRYRLHRTACE